MNTLHLNSVRLNGIGEVQSVSLSAGADPEQPPVEPSKYIQFEDPAVEAICVANWSSDGIGLTMEDAAAVTSIGTVFKGNTEITSFDEFEYFTGVTTIKEQAFMGCTALKSIVLRHVQTIERYAFRNCSALEIEVDMPNLGGVLQYGTFTKSGIKSVKSLGNITAITGYDYETGAFGDCPNLVEVNLPDSLTKIGAHAFTRDTSLAIVNYDWSRLVSLGDSAFNGCACSSELNLESLTGTLGMSAFYGTKVRKLLGTGSATTLGSTTTSSGTSGCFQNCSELIEATLSDGLQYIGKHCFRDTAISEITIPNSVVGISGNAFYSCDNLTTVDIGSGCESIGASVFEFCKIIEKVICRASTPPSLAYYVFRNTNSTFLIYVPDASLEAYKTATNWVSYADRIHPLSEIEGSPYIQFEDPVTEAICIANWSSDGVGLTKEDAAAVTSIGTVFKGNTQITSFDELKYFTGVTSLGTNCFSGCSALASIDMSNVTSIGQRVFNGASALNGNFVAPNLETINQYYAFMGAAFKRYVNLGKVATIPAQCWGSGHNAVECIIVPGTVTTIGNNQFYGDYGGSHVWVMKSSVPCSVSTGGWSGSHKYYVPDSAVDTYKAATGWSTWTAKIFPISQLATDNPTLYEEIKDYLL